MLQLFSTRVLQIIFSASILTIVAVIIYLMYTKESLRRAKINLEKSLEKLKSAYNEMDEQAKIIVRTDLELNKTQEELDKKINGLYTLHELGRTLRTSLNPDNMFSLIDESFLFKLGFEKALLVLIGEKEELDIKLNTRYKSEDVEMIKRKLLENNLPNFIFKHKFLLVNQLEKVDEQENLLAAVFNLLFFIVVPIAIKDTVSGFLVVGNNSPFSKITEGDVDIVFILGSQIAVAIENASLYEEIWRSHQSLERRVEQRTRELAQANEELKRLNKMKSEFVSAVSHELRTPLTSIKGYAALLMSGKLGEVAQTVKERLEKINKQSDKLTNFINDLLDISRIESGRVEMKFLPLDLNEVAQVIADLLQPQLKEKAILLKYEIPQSVGLVNADRAQLERVFINLLNNAIKFTPQAGQITLRANKEKNFVQVEVADTGIGISDEDQARIFEEFYRAANPINEEVKGTGLGLSLVKQIIQAHQGKIWVTSQLGKGSTFHFTLPAA
jgi:signal transduction histidine kinase